MSEPETLDEWWAYAEAVRIALTDRLGPDWIVATIEATPAVPGRIPVVLKAHRMNTRHGSQALRLDFNPWAGAGLLHPERMAIHLAGTFHRKIEAWLTAMDAQAAAA